MPGTRTLADLTTQVRRRADMENTQFVTDAEIQQYIQDSYGELYDLLIESAGVDWFTQTLNFDTVAGQASYALNDRLGVSPPYETRATPLSIYKVLALTVEFQGYHRPIRPGYHRQPGDTSASLPWVRPEDVVYQVHQASSWREITFYPVPAGAYSCVLYYIPSPPDLSGDGTGFNDVILNGFAGWDEYVVVDAAAKCLEKEESDARHLYKRKAEVAERIRWHAQTMNQDGPGHVRNVDVDLPLGRW